PGGFDGNGGNANNAADGGGDARGEVTPSNSNPHAVGVITLGESHVAGASTSSPIVSALFVARAQDAIAAKCSEDVDGCTVTPLPDCGDGSDAGGSSCTPDQVCVLDDD